MAGKVTKKVTETKLKSQFGEQQAILNGINEVIYVADPDTYELLYVNNAAQNIWGDVTGKTCYQALRNLDSPCPYCTNHIIFSDNKNTHVWEFQDEKTQEWFRCVDKAIDWPDGRKVRYGMAIDITRQKEIEEALIAQSMEILELSTPVIQIWEGVVIAPLIGTLDSQRTLDFMERFLNRIVETKSPVAIVDITGVSIIDTQTAQNLLETVSASRLLGTKVIMTGIRPSIAQTLVHLGIDLSSIETHTSLANGLKAAFKILGMQIVKKL